ncbi:hypothetical protein N7495_002207 [Penicillium taxi]|uniref:uncharacterized protein n=1 Tax=Penicillium taxi TaxID=168475 RepID=UPI002545A631|nr:uncharacterized protein N7495_002207 [Penicillium taxi]KAJ5901679.1 hypothetical protein N7495_002207 [Penicillium taxi]
MEVPAEEMEMASPYQGQADDFDIDIDLMDDQEQDHASNLDSEMMGADEFHNNSQPSLFPNDVNDDADMAEPSAEGSMVDADNDVEFQYDDTTYEAEMQENDHDEILDASHPIVQIESMSHLENVMDEFEETTTEVGHKFISDAQEYPPPTEDTPAETGQRETGQQETGKQETGKQETGKQETGKQETGRQETGQQETGQQETAQQETAQQETGEQETGEQETGEQETEEQETGEQETGEQETGEQETGEQETGEQETGEQETAQQEQAIASENTQVENTQPELSLIPENTETTEDITSGAESNKPAEGNIEAARDGTSPKALEGFEDRQAEPSNEAETESLVPVEGDELKNQLTHDNESLHPVKVSYQDSEISLFPPLEGDSAETFFLHDEDLAYSSVGILFESLRTVLMGSIAESDILVIDVDALGVQITEDSQHTSKITLYQIIDIYLRLCHNDEIEEPEALYITLTSQPAAHLELASLEAAANEGKGLSQISPCDYFEVDSTSEDDTQYIEEAHSDPVQHESGVDSTSPKEVLNGDESRGESHEEGQETNVGQEENLQNDYQLESGDGQNDPESAVAEVQDEQETYPEEETDFHEENATYSDRENDEVGTHIDELGSGSTSTLAPEEQPDLADVAEDGSQQDDFNLETDQGFDNEGVAGETKTLDLEASGLDEDFVGENDEENENHPAPTEGEDALDEQDHAPEYEDATYISAGNIPHQEQTPEPENYLLGIAEDLMKTPARDQQEDLIDYDYEDEFPEDDQNIQSIYADVKGSYDELSGNVETNSDFEDGDFKYGDFGEGMAHDSAHIDSNVLPNPSAKRCRVDEEEEEFVDTNSPDIKRRRS